MTEPPLPPEEPDLPEPDGNPRVNRYGQRGALTPELQDRIVRVVAAGNYLKVAAQFCGIGESTLRAWLSRGRAAANARDSHPEDRLYCPGCDRDRTDDVEAETEANRREEERPLEDGEVRGYAVLDRCPACGTSDRPRPWELPPEDARYLAFLEAITRAETTAEVAAVTHWRAAFANDWRAARDFLVRSKPDRWAATTRVQITQEEADRRIDTAVEQVLVAAGVDIDGDLLGGEVEGLFDGGSLDLDLDDDDA